MGAWSNALYNELKSKGAHEPKAHTAGAYTGFRSMKQA